MHEESPKRTLLVGATGYAGRKLANYLLTSTDATVILSGRDRTKLGDLQSSLPAVDLSRRTELLEPDAANVDVTALTDFDLLVNAPGTGRHNASMIQACLERRADWIDMQITNELLNPPTELRAKIERAGCRFVIQAGFHPGILAALVHHAAQQMDTIHSAIVGSVIRDRTACPSPRESLGLSSRSVTPRARCAKTATGRDWTMRPIRRSTSSMVLASYAPLQ